MAKNNVNDPPPEGYGLIEQRLIEAHHQTDDELDNLGVDHLIANYL